MQCRAPTTRTSVPKPFTSSRGRVTCSSSVPSGVDVAPTMNRRQILEVATSVALAISVPLPAMAKQPKGFSAVQDINDGYQFLYPFGWQEISVKGADIVFKDVIEPLESVSVTIVETDKNDVTEFGDVTELADALAKNVLTGPGNEVTIVATSQMEVKGRNYFEFEFTAKNSSYTRHSLAVVVVANGKFFTLTTGSNARRWNKVKPNLETVVKSFQLTI
jgi:photosystem II oxygen-evolving enhancer protein 2